MNLISSVIYFAGFSKSNFVRDKFLIFKILPDFGPFRVFNIFDRDSADDEASRSFSWIGLDRRAILS